MNLMKQHNAQNFGGFSHKASIVATDLRCYFGCNQGFKKDYDLRLHIKLRHKDEDDSEVAKAYQHVEEEIALTRRSLSIYQCALCSEKLPEAGPFYEHTKTAHNMQWLEYKDKYGRCEVEQGSFECKICMRVVKYDRGTVDAHLSKVHSINWTSYLDRVRKMRQGEKPKELPNIELFECKICNSTVKYIFRTKHLKGSHKITESEYIELYKEELEKSSAQNNMSNNTNEMLGYDMNPRLHNMDPMNRNEQYANNVIPEEDFSDVANNSFPKPPKSDIKDKTNKTCSSCAITYESRRLFIEHCTTVHDMKFRTVSGATISAPPQHMFQQTTFPQNRFDPNEMTNSNTNYRNIAQPTSYRRDQGNNNLEIDDQTYLDEPEDISNIGAETRYGRKINRPERLNNF